MREGRMVSGFARFMSWFWWSFACPQPDGRFNCALRGKPYAWTARLHTPWYLLAHPGERFRVKRFPWWRIPFSVLLMPVGALIPLIDRTWRRRVRAAACRCGIPEDKPGHGTFACSPASSAKGKR